MREVSHANSLITKCQNERCCSSGRSILSFCGRGNGSPDRGFSFTAYSSLTVRGPSFEWAPMDLSDVFPVADGYPLVVSIKATVAGSFPGICETIITPETKVCGIGIPKFIGHDLAI